MFEIPDTMNRKSPKILPKGSDTKKEKVYLFERMLDGTATSHDLVRLSLLRGMISNKEYEEFLEIENAFKQHD